MQRWTLFGRPLGIGLIILQKTLWGIALLVAGIVLLIFRVYHVTQPFQVIFARELAEDPHDLLATTLIRLAPEVSLTKSLLLSVTACVYALLEGVEVWGLWRGLIWVEVLIVVETAGLLPYDTWELTHHFSMVKILLLVINILIVLYLLRSFLRKLAAKRAELVLKVTKKLPAARSGLRK
jgi:uncharacterized membrane protein (DUF2068 family)